MVNSHSHRGFSPVPSQLRPEGWNRFNSFLFAVIFEYLKNR